MVVLVIASWLAVIPSAAGASESCATGAAANSSTFSAVSVCPPELQQAASTVSAQSGATITYAYTPVCVRGEGITGQDFYGCGEQLECGRDGLMFNVVALHPGGWSEPIGQRCFQPSEVPAAATVTADAVLRAFRRIPVPASEVTIQPPGGKTLVNLDTVFSTEAEGFTRTIGLLGHRVDLDITPSEFRWVAGDGTVRVTDWAGRPWREGASLADLITHRYEDVVNGLRPRVDTTWSARYRVDGGPWRDVPGTVTITGASYDLAVLSASPALTGAG